MIHIDYNYALQTVTCYSQYVLQTITCNRQTTVIVLLLM